MNRFINPLADSLSTEVEVKESVRDFGLRWLASARNRSFLLSTIREPAIRARRRIYFSFRPDRLVYAERRTPVNVTMHPEQQKLFKPNEIVHFDMRVIIIVLSIIIQLINLTVSLSHAGCQQHQYLIFPSHERRRGFESRVVSVIPRTNRVICETNRLCTLSD